MTASSSGPLSPGAIIGILGGGQLGRMTALAAARLGYPCHIYTDEQNSPASQVAAKTTVASYSDEVALAAFAKDVAVVTFEFENIPEITAETLARHVIVRPGPRCLAIAQDRLREKDFLNGIGAPTAPYRRVTSVEDLTQALRDLGRPAVLKTTRFGYDGKGQVMIDGSMKPAAAWKQMAGAAKHPEGVLEGFVDFEREISVIVARAPDGTWAAFDPVENRHVHHVLDTTIAPAAVPYLLSQFHFPSIRSRIVSNFGPWK